MINISKLDLNLLRVFDVLVKERRVSSAAVTLGLSQPAISNALGRLRRLTGDPLFVPTRRGMEPTPYALEIAAPVSSALAMLRSGLERSASFDPAMATKRITLLMTDVGEVVFLPRLLPRLWEAAPGIDVRVMQLPYAEYASALESGTADLALGTLTWLSGSFYQQNLFSNRYVALFRKDHGLLGRSRTAKRIDLRAYLSASHVAVAPPNANADAVDRALSARGHTRRIALQVPHFMVLPSILARTELVATVPEKVVPALDAVTLASAALSFTVENVHIRQCWHARLNQDPANRWLRNLIKGLF